MAYLAPHFDPDVFVSYSHGDARGGGEWSLKDWTQALIRRLEGQIFDLDTEFNDLTLWIDAQIDPTAHLTDGLRAKVGASGVLIIVMSKRYLQSSWCRDELEWFRKQVQERAADSGRVFIIRAQPTEESQWPQFLRDERGHAMPGFAFFDLATGYPLGWPDPHAADRDFVKELCRLQTALTKRLRELKERAGKRAEAETAARAAPLPALAARRVYLYAPPDEEPVRAEIGQELIDDGIVPLTARSGGGRGLADWQRDANTRMETAKRCEALALIRVGDGERFVGDLLDIGVDERERIASARGAPLPCAVLDKTGEDLPLDVSQFGIERFDVNRDGWRGAFRDWLNVGRARRPAAAP
jgi:hypothetical protein